MCSSIDYNPFFLTTEINNSSCPAEILTSSFDKFCKTGKIPLVGSYQYNSPEIMADFRPRGALARALYEKVHNDRYLDEYDTTLWYTLSSSLSEKFQSKFFSLDAPDEITLDWLDKARVLSGNLWLQLWHVVAKLFLGLFMNQTDINGWLKRGSMFILSEVQFRNLLIAGGFRVSNENIIDMLDIGAGDGEVTTRLAKAVIHTNTNVLLKVYTTETSWTMRDRLQDREFTVIDDLKEISNVSLVSCLNVLDRCADPHQILSDIHDILAPDGRVIIALVLPYSHYVENNTSHMPLKPLLPHWPGQGRLPFETEAEIFLEQLELMGFVVESWTKAPYLCEGDLRQSFYWLVDLVVVLSKAPKHLEI